MSTTHLSDSLNGLKRKRRSEILFAPEPYFIKGSATKRTLSTELGNEGWKLVHDENVMVSTGIVSTELVDPASVVPPAMITWGIPSI